ncbi:MAG: hypothetical protein JO112_15975, partial [Planctomycetes bacterium]|nr:hypothetical protein [Planctomycetota bacterium]
VPHRKCFVINRHLLFQYVEQDDLDLESNRLLPSRVILLARPDSENLANEDRETVLLKYWRRLFHANLHLNLERLIQEGSLSPEDIRDRIEQIGQAEFEEIHLVLDQDHYLFPHADEQAVYIEFAAVFLEMHYFEANLLPVYFPGILDFERIYHLVAQDLDAEALFNQTRLSGAPTPANRPDNSLDESNDYYWRLVRSSERAIRQGNTIRAAITRMRAARVAPASLTQSTRGKAMADLERLTMRLQAALHLSDEEAHEWLKDLPALLEKADQGSRPVEASLLYDLQKVCLDHERDIYTLDLVEWLLSAGKRPIKRPLPSQRLVRITKHLRSAAQRLAMARLSDTDRQHLADLLQTALHRSEDRLRARFRPLLLDALQDAGLQPSTPPERTAFHKIIEEMLDRIVEYGFLTFSDLRDILSRNQLKLPDLGDPQEFARGDQLLRLDRRLSTMLDGVYRPGEIYLRWLERFTALNFGTRIGRTITRYVTIPFGGAFLLTTGLELVMDEFHGPKIPPLTKWTLFAALSLFLFAFVNQGSFRQRIAHGLRLTGRTIRTLFIEVPNRLLHISALQRFLHSWAFQLFSWYLLKPLIVWALLYWWRPDFFRPWLQGLGIFVGLSVVLNTRLGKAALDTLTQGVVNLWDLLRAGLIPGLFRLLVGLFKHIIHLVEYVLFTVDEWLRFRSGDSMLSMVLRTVLGVLWFPVSWVARFYMVVLIEPGINPIKFPVSSLAAKIIYPFGVVLTTFLIQLLRPVMGGFLASVFSVTTVWLLP